MINILRWKKFKSNSKHTMIRQWPDMISTQNMLRIWPYKLGILNQHFDVNLRCHCDLVKEVVLKALLLQIVIILKWTTGWRRKKVALLASERLGNAWGDYGDFENNKQVPFLCHIHVKFYHTEACWWLPLTHQCQGYISVVYFVFTAVPNKAIKGNSKNRKVKGGQAFYR